MRVGIVSAVCLMVAALVAGATMAAEVVTAAPQLDLQRYAGTWYEVARVPNRFQTKCARDVTTIYDVLPDNSIRIDNRCLDGSGKVRQAIGQARVKAPGTVNSKLEARFAPGWLSWVPWAWFDYWVIELDPDYRYSVVASPGRKYLWILSRTPTLDEQTYTALLQKISAQGFDISLLAKTPQSGSPTPAP